MRTVVFIADRAMLPGLHAALCSMLEHLQDDGRFYIVTVFADCWTERDKRQLGKTHSANRKSTQLVIRDFSPRLPEGANTLHGNATAYGRIFLSKLLPDSQQCLYLDSDLVVEREIGELFELISSDRTLVADGVGKRRWSLDVALYERAGLDLNSDCFNSGVLGINLERWRKGDVDRKLHEALCRWAGMFRSADQALLNVVLQDDFVPAGKDFNWPLTPDEPELIPNESRARIYHFVGSPKPWDVGGRWLHPNYSLWRRYFERTAIARDPLLRYQKIGRTLRTARSLIRHARRQLWEGKPAPSLS